MEIQIDPHTLERAEERGTNGDEIKDVIQTGFAIPAKYGRKGKPRFISLSKIVSISIMKKKGLRYFILLKGA